MSRPDKSDKDNDKKQQRTRHLSGGDELLKAFLLVHECCAEMSNNATPRRFMAFLHCYRELYKSKKEGIEEKQKHLQVYSICTFHIVFNALFCLIGEELGSVTLADDVACCRRMVL
jgi:hypothetical protein